MTGMSKFPSIVATALSLLVNAPSPALAQAEHEQHHPQGGAAANPPAEPTPPNKDVGASDTSKGGMMGGGMMGNMMQGGMMGMMDGCPMMGMMMGRGDTATRATGRVAFLKAELAITDTQKEVWEAYAAALKKNLEGMQSMRQSMMKMMEARSPVERLDQHIAAMDGRSAALKELKPALSNLYAALSDEQKKTADQLLSGMGCMM